MGYYLRCVLLSSLAGSSFVLRLCCRWDQLGHKWGALSSGDGCLRKTIGADCGVLCGQLRRPYNWSYGLA